jgi:hypothetical protein
MNFHLGSELANPGANFEHLQTDRVKLRFGKLRFFQMDISKGMHQHIGHAVEKKPELIGFKPGTRRSIREKMIFVFFDHKLGNTSSAVDRLIDETPVGMSQIGNNETKIWTLVCIFSFEDDSLRGSPGIGLIGKLTKELNRLLRITELLLCFLHELLCVLQHRLLGCQAKDIVDLVFLTKVKDLRRTVMAVTTQDNPHIGPGSPDHANNPFENRDNLFARRSLAWA